MSLLSQILSSRDLLSQISNNSFEVSKIYAGFDGTAKSLQIGNLTPIAALRHLSKIGIKPIIVLGGATSTVGDPSGKNTTRTQLAYEAVSSNINAIQLQISKLLPEAIIVNNMDWLSKLSFMDFLNEAASFLSVSYLLNFKTFADRLSNNQPLTIKEILYPLMQGFDFLYLFENLKCQAQLGGHDQWCNVLTGVDLIQKKHSKETPVVAVTAPLLVDSAGNKMGKSLQGAIYLDSSLCSAYDFWSFWRNIEDSLVKTCLLRFSDFSVQEIDQFLAIDINHAKIQLADFMTSWVHSEQEAIEAKNTATSIFINKNFEDLPLITLTCKRLSDIVANIKKISTSEAKRLITSYAVKVDHDIVSDISFSFDVGTEFLLFIGKKDVFKVLIKK